MANSSAGSLPRLPFKLPTDPGQLIPWLDQKKEAGKPAVQNMQMKLNLAFVLGYQWVTWDARVRAYRRPNIDVTDPNAPVRLKSNKIGSLLERAIAKLTKTAPLPEARPVSDDDNDVDSARVGTRILSHEMDRLNWRSRLQKFMFWPGTLGWSYMHVYWDPNAGEVLANDPDPDIEDAIMQGDICMEEVPAFELSVDPSANCMEEAKWVVRTTTMTREAAWERWDVELEGGAERNLSQEVHALGPVENVVPNDDWVQVNQLWMVPCKAAPKGAVITWAGNTVIEKKEFPYEHGMVPFIQCNFLPGIGTREGRTWVNDLLDLQTDYNDNMSREATIRRQLTPKLIYAVGQIDAQRLTSRVEAIPYMPGISQNPPHLEMPNAAWAQQFEMGMNRDANDMGERAGQGEASQGQAASTAPAASILALQEADDTKLALSATEMAQFIADIGRHILLLAKQFWSEERVVRVWSEENVLAAYRYSAADIDERCDVHVSSESALPKSKAARAQLILELQARFPQLISPQDTIRMLELPGVDFLVRSIDVHTKKQWREITKMLDGCDCEVAPFDNHAIHLSVLNDFRCTADYENLQDEQKAVFDAHAAVHEMLVLKQLGMAVPSPQPQVDPYAMQQAQMVSAGPAGGHPAPHGNMPYAIDPMTGMPQDPTAVASGQAPAPQPLTQGRIAKAAGIGQAAGQPGRVPGIPADHQAHRMGN
jgi:hypothetical protein